MLDKRLLEGEKRLLGEGMRLLGTEKRLLGAEAAGNESPGGWQKQASAVICLRGRYRMSGTDLAYARTRLRGGGSRPYRLPAGAAR